MEKAFTKQEVRKMLYEIQEKVMDEGYGLGEAIDTIVTEKDL